MTKAFLKKKRKVIQYNYLKDKIVKSFPILIYIILAYILNEMLLFYLDQNSHGGVNFWVFEIFIIHFFLFKKNNFKLYKHQTLSFSIIIIFSFGIKFISSFLKQCDYPVINKDDMNEKFINYTRNLPPSLLEKLNLTKLNETISDSVRKVNKEGVKACKNMYNIFLLDDYFEYLIILSGIGYLLGLFLHSFSAIKFKYYIDIKFISPYLIIFLIGLFGFILNIILLLLSSFISCGKNYYIANFCHLIKYEYDSIKQTAVIKDTYFDNFFYYIFKLKETFHPLKNEYNNGYIRQTKDGILEIIFSILFLPILGFFKTIYDLNIIKELGVFHLLIPEAIYQLLKDLIIMIYKLAKGIIDKSQITQFILMGISNSFAILGFGIYLELIEIRCCGFDENIKQNIIYRSIIDQKDTNEESYNNNRLSDDREVTEKNFYLESEI